MDTPEEPEPEENESESLGNIRISLIGIATRGKMAIVKTIDEETGKAIISTVTITDPEGNAQIIETNSPVRGFGMFKIAEDSDVPVTLIASCDGYESGTYLINELKGEKLSEEQEPEPTKTLQIKGVSGEFLVGNILNGTVLVSETNEPADNAKVTITKPDNSKLVTHTDSNGLFKVFVDTIGTWTAIATKADHTDSAEASITSRVPRKDIGCIKMFRGNQGISTANAKETVTFGIYDDNYTLIEENFAGTISFMGHDETVAFESGWLSYQMPENDVGSFTVNVDKSENWNEASETFEVAIGFDFSAILLPIGVIVVAIIIIAIIARLIGRRGSGGGAQYGTPPSMEEKVG